MFWKFWKSQAFWKGELSHHFFENVFLILGKYHFFNETPRMSASNISKNNLSSIKWSYLVHFLGEIPSFLDKNLKNPSQKKFLTFLEMDLSSSNIKKVLIFSQRKAFLISSQKKKNFSFIFSKEIFSYISFQKWLPAQNCIILQ